jgi:hypothetical protein
LSARKKIAPRKNLASQKKSRAKKFRKKKFNFSLDILFLCAIMTL